MGHKNSKMMDENEEISHVVDDDDLLLDKIEEAIKSPTKLQRNGENLFSDKSECDEKLKENEDILNGDDEEFLETLIDQKAEDELLGIEDEQQSYSVERDLEELFNNVQTENEKLEEHNDVEENDVDEFCLKSDGDQKQDDIGLLDECEPPKKDAIEDEQSEVPSNEDDGSNQNGISDQDNESYDEHEKKPEEISDSKQENEASVEVTKEPPQKESDDTSNTNELVIDQSKETTEVVPGNALIDDSEVHTETPKIISTESEDVEMKDNGELTTFHQDIEKTEDVDKETNTDEQNDIEMTDTADDKKNKQPDENKLNIKMEMDTKSTGINPPRIQFNFMRKFAKECGKLSRADLEEFLLEKVTESIVYKSQCTELRTMFEKQEEIIERLQKRLAVVTKQYNDLDMIHKRVEKDLKERPEGPIQPVRITRAVGLQVFLEKANLNLSNNAAVSTTATGKGKQVSNNVTNAPTSATKNVSPIAKRSIDLDTGGVRNVTSENEPKRKKCKIITPLRPMLSEKEETSLRMQEASIEKNIRMKVATKVTNAANPAHVAQKISSPNLSVTPIHTNGIQKQASM